MLGKGRRRGGFDPSKNVGGSGQSNLRFPHRCLPCGVYIANETELKVHINSDRHILADSFNNNRYFFNQITANSLFKITAKHCALSNNELRVRKNVRNTIVLEIEGITNSISILDISGLGNYPHVQLDVKKMNFPMVLFKGETIKAQISVTILGYGTFEVPIGFHYYINGPGKREIPYHCIVLRIVTESELSAPLRPVVPYKKPKKKMFIPVKEKISGPAHDYSTNLMEVKRMKSYLPPDQMLALVQCNLKEISQLKRDELILLRQMKKCLGEKEKSVKLTEDNYVTRFKYLLHIEEIQENIDVDQFSQSNAILIPVSDNHDRYLQLEIGAGLADGRPSLMLGDKVLIRPLDGVNHGFRRGWYIGSVKKVQLTNVWLLFTPKFHILYKPYIKVEVKFELNRSPYQIAHRAVELVRSHEMSWLFFPTCKKFPFGENPFAVKELLLVNKLIKTNPEQIKAVLNIVNRTAMPYPYLVFGPPGTGKTVTLVEAILQNYLFNLENPRKQLVCASSNAAADVITERLIRAGVIPDKEIFRMYSPKTQVQQLPDIIRDHKECHNVYFSESNNEYGVNIPNITTIMDKSIVITTLVTAGRLVSGMISYTHFSHVLIDEAGHSMEPECLVPIMGIVTGPDKLVHGQIVLAGDPKQLGPVLTSVAKDYGLETSLLERLMDTQPMYMRDKATSKYDNRVVSKLVRNFRSHPAILKLPNRFFYCNELVAMGNKSLINRFSQWNGLEKKGFPIIFHGIKGDESRENTSPSYFNIQEIDQVLDYMDQLVGKTINGKFVRETDIAVVSPYKKQVQKLGIAFRKKGWNITVGSVEQLQGDERLIIVISTVRSKAVKDDNKMSLGFLKNSKRFNVAITRAQALLIIIGNPHVLRTDKNWGQMLRYCVKNGGYRGEPISIEDIDDFSYEDDVGDDNHNVEPSLHGGKENDNYSDVKLLSTKTDMEPKLLVDINNDLATLSINSSLPESQSSMETYAAVNTSSVSITHNTRKSQSVKNDTESVFEDFNQRSSLLLLKESSSELPSKIEQDNIVEPLLHSKSVLSDGVDNKLSSLDIEESSSLSQLEDLADDSESSLSYRSSVDSDNYISDLISCASETGYCDPDELDILCNGLKDFSLDAEKVVSDNKCIETLVSSNASHSVINECDILARNENNDVDIHEVLPLNKLSLTASNTVKDKDYSNFIENRGDKKFEIKEVDLESSICRTVSFIEKETNDYSLMNDNQLSTSSCIIPDEKVLMKYGSGQSNSGKVDKCHSYSEKYEHDLNGSSVEDHNVSFDSEITDKYSRPENYEQDLNGRLLDDHNVAIDSGKMAKYHSCTENYEQVLNCCSVEDSNISSNSGITDKSHSYSEKYEHDLNGSSVDDHNVSIDSGKTDKYHSCPENYEQFLNGSLVDDRNISTESGKMDKCHSHSEKYEHDLNGSSVDDHNVSIDSGKTDKYHSCPENYEQDLNGSLVDDRNISTESGKMDKCHSHSEKYEHDINGSPVDDRNVSIDSGKTDKYHSCPENYEQDLSGSLVDDRNISTESGKMDKCHSHSEKYEHDINGSPVDDHNVSIDSGKTDKYHSCPENYEQDLNGSLVDDRNISTESGKMDKCHSHSEKYEHDINGSPVDDRNVSIDSGKTDKYHSCPENYEQDLSGSLVDDRNISTESGKMDKCHSHSEKYEHDLNGSSVDDHNVSIDSGKTDKYHSCPENYEQDLNGSLVDDRNISTESGKMDKCHSHSEKYEHDINGSPVDDRNVSIDSGKTDKYHSCPENYEQDLSGSLVDDRNISTESGKMDKCHSHSEKYEHDINGSPVDDHNVSVDSGKTDKYHSCPENYEQFLNGSLVDDRNISTESGKMDKCHSHSDKYEHDLDGSSVKDHNVSIDSGKTDKYSCPEMYEQDLNGRLLDDHNVSIDSGKMARYHSCPENYEQVLNGCLVEDSNISSNSGKTDKSHSYSEKYEHDLNGSPVDDHNVPINSGKTDRYHSCPENYEPDFNGGLADGIHANETEDKLSETNTHMNGVKEITLEDSILLKSVENLSVALPNNINRTPVCNTDEVFNKYPSKEPVASNVRSNHGKELITNYFLTNSCTEDVIDLKNTDDKIVLKSSDDFSNRKIQFIDNVKCTYDGSSVMYNFVLEDPFIEKIDRSINKAHQLENLISVNDNSEDVRISKVNSLTDNINKLKEVGHIGDSSSRKYVNSISNGTHEQCLKGDNSVTGEILLKGHTISKKLDIKNIKPADLRGCIKKETNKKDEKLDKSCFIS